MTAILVVCTVALFLGIELWRRKRSPIEARPAMVPGIVADDVLETPADLFFGPGHTWSRIEADGSVSVGVDRFASKVLGRVDAIDVAPTGNTLDRQDAVFVLRQGDKSAAFATPFEASVMEVNRDLLENPDRIVEDPYGHSWLLRLQPRRLADGLQRLRVAEDARQWMRDEIMRLSRFLEEQTASATVGATLPDGGVLIENILETLDGKVWEQFEAEFLTR